MQKWKDTLGELVETFSPDYYFVDGGTADTYCNKQSYVVQDAFREIVAITTTMPAQTDTSRYLRSNASLCTRRKRSRTTKGAT